MHPNSLISWAMFDFEGRAHEICKALETLGEASTCREIATYLGHPDNMNYTSPTITGLVQRGVLVEVADVDCPVTERPVRTVWFAPEETLRELLMLKGKLTSPDSITPLLTQTPPQAIESVNPKEVPSG